MMILKVFVLIAVLNFIDVEANIHYQQLLKKMKTMDANGKQFSLEDLINFAAICIAENVSAEVITADVMSDINAGRNLLDVPSIFCTPYSVVNTANATALNLPECLISNVEPGTTVSISDCSSTCVGDQYLRLFDYDSNVELSANDDGECVTSLHSK